jgi:hypothetical protein
VSGFPAFSADGRFLYFSQYLNDTNFDGIIDGNDHSVLFRAPFDGARAQPVATAEVEQLTSAYWNCQYPAPAAGRLITTCLYQGSLDVYSLPLDGSLPRSWDTAKLTDELRSSTNRWEKLLLLSRVMARDPRDRPERLREIVRLHLGLGELESAEFYAQHLMKLGGGDAELGAAVVELIAHRRAERALDRGQLSAEFVLDARARLEQLRQVAHKAGPAGATMAALALSEVLDVLGDKDQALAALRSIAVAKQTDPFLLHQYGERALAIDRELDDREALLDCYRALSAHEALSERERLDYAAAFVRELERGRPRGEQASLLDGWRAKVDKDSELGFLLALERSLFDLSPVTQEQVRATVFELFKRNHDVDRRKSLVDATVRRAAQENNDYLLYQFANTYVSGVGRELAERRHAETLYRQVVLERAYIESSRGAVGDARGNFFGVTLQTDSLEAHIGFVEERIREGKTDIEAEYTKRFSGKPDDPIYRFVRAYLLARRLPELDDLALKRAADEAIGHLQVVARGVSHSLELHHLWGYVAHQRYLRSGDQLSALEANAHYLLALDLARDNPRYRAPLRR